MIDFGFGVHLGPITADHGHVLFDWRNNPALMRWTRQHTVLTEGQHGAWMADQMHDDKMEMLGIFYKYTDAGKTYQQLVGVCGLTSIDLLNRNAEFSCYVGPEFSGKGYGSGALKTLFTHGFEAWGLERIWGETFDGNPAAHIFEKLGMTKEGTQRNAYFRNGRFIDCHIYGLLKSDWDIRLQEWGQGRIIDARGTSLQRGSENREASFRGDTPVA